MAQEERVKNLSEDGWSEEISDEIRVLREIMSATFNFLSKERVPEQFYDTRSETTDSNEGNLIHCFLYVFA